METREIRFQADGLELAGELHIPSKGKANPTLCICHGIPAAPPDPIDKGYALLAQQSCRAGFVTLIFYFLLREGLPALARVNEIVVLGLKGFGKFLSANALGTSCLASSATSVAAVAMEKAGSSCRPG
jgi:hypothetical protein